MKQFKFYILISVVIFLSSCSTLKEGFTGKTKNNSDEFLVEKKSPLVMPPDYNELPIPNEENLDKEENDIKSLISKSKNSDIKEDSNENKSSFEGLILEKIKNN
jgi:hypothetical protein